MKAKLYIPYNDCDLVNDFQANINFTEEEYVNYVNNAYKQSKLVMDGLSKVNTYEDMNFKKQRYKFYEADITLLDINTEDENIDNLIKYFQTGEMFIVQLYFDNIEQMEEIDEEMRFWYRESEKINTSIKLSQDIKLKSLPTKNLKINFGDNSTAVLDECRLIERYSCKRYAILVQKITFITD